jgi:hypothetical protein
MLPAPRACTAGLFLGLVVRMNLPLAGVLTIGINGRKAAGDERTNIKSIHAGSDIYQ